VGAEDGHRFAGLNEECLVVFERSECLKDGIEACPIPCRLAAAAIDDEIFRFFSDLRIEVVLDHPIGSLGEP
jgi:hypothetical protein